jgi:hypothetical protein
MVSHKSYSRHLVLVFTFTSFDERIENGRGACQENLRNAGAVCQKFRVSNCFINKALYGAASERLKR